MSDDTSTPPAIQPLPRGMPFEWLVALRFLREGRVQTIFIIGGVAIGVGVIVFMSALLSGLQTNFVKRVLTGQAHIQLLPPKETARTLRGTDTLTIEGSIVQPPLQRLKSIDQWQSVAAQIRALPEVNVVSPAANGSALVVRGDASRAINVVGIEPELYFRIVPMPEKIVRGTARITINDILIGTELANDLGVSVGDKLRVTSASGHANTLTITGIFDLGNKPANARTTMMALRSAQSLLGLPGGVSTLDVTVHDVYGAELVAHRITQLTGVEADSWIKTNEQFSQPSAHKPPPTQPSECLWVCRWRLALPVCWWCLWFRSRARLASCAPWASRVSKFCASFCCKAGCLALGVRWQAQRWARRGLWFGSKPNATPMAR